MKSRKLSNVPAVADQCLCGAVQFEMEYHAFWAWHDHSRASRLAHGAVYETYVGTWRKRFRITAGEREINRGEQTGAVRSFCRCCGTPLVCERTHSRHMINIQRTLFQSRTGRQPIYHIAIEEMQDWAYAGEPLVPLKGYPGVLWKRRRRKVAYGRPASQHRSGSVVRDHRFRRPVNEAHDASTAPAIACSTVT
jgi:hypothetical protein